jgi:hypothetical protein
VQRGCFPLFMPSSYRCFIIGLKPRPGSCYGIPFAWLIFQVGVSFFCYFAMLTFPILSSSLC